MQRLVARLIVSHGVTNSFNHTCQAVWTRRTSFTAAILEQNALRASSKKAANPQKYN